jgi:hypothetical protein
MKPEDWQRAGFVEKNGALERVKNANRTVSETETSNVGIAGHNDPIVQKQQTADCKISERQTIGAPTTHNEAGISGGDAADYGRFRVTVVFRFSNRRRTDLSGKLDTILDCLVHARRRLLGDDTGDTDKRRKVRGRKRGGSNYNREAVKEIVPF